MTTPINIFKTLFTFIPPVIDYRLFTVWVTYRVSACNELEVNSGDKSQSIPAQSPYLKNYEEIEGDLHGFHPGEDSIAAEFQESEIVLPRRQAFREMLQNLKNIRIAILKVDQDYYVKGAED